MWTSMLLLLALLHPQSPALAPSHLPPSHLPPSHLPPSRPAHQGMAPACYAAQLIVVAHDESDRVIDRIVSTGVWRFGNASDANAGRCVPADSGAFASLEEHLARLLDSTLTNATAHRAIIELRDTSLVLMRRTIRSIAGGAAATRGAFQYIEVPTRASSSVRPGTRVDLDVFAADPAKAAACAKHNDAQRGAGAPFQWAC